jgi:mono/diheme cytochrome c family protein
MKRLLLLSGVLILGSSWTLFSAAQERSQAKSDPAPTAAASYQSEDELRLEGEKAFRANCGRCHMAPHKFPPRVMVTVLRHMRVRATLTDEDVRIILHYMTQ